MIQHAWHYHTRGISMRCRSIHMSRWYSRFHEWAQFKLEKWENHEWNGESLDMCRVSSEYNNKPVSLAIETMRQSTDTKQCIQSVPSVFSLRLSDKFLLSSSLQVVRLRFRAVRITPQEYNTERSHSSSDRIRHHHHHRRRRRHRCGSSRAIRIVRTSVWMNGGRQYTADTHTRCVYNVHVEMLESV